MLADIRKTRLEHLRATQNADGGWPFVPGKQSWLEPTCYALLALYGDESSRACWQRGWNLIRSWQKADGGFPPAAQVPASCWTTSLMVTSSCVYGTKDQRFKKAVEWLLASKGSEGSWLERALVLVWRAPVEYDRRYKGWPWWSQTSSWIEPTAHALLALKKAAPWVNHAGLHARVEEGEHMMLDRRSSDGGWNSGNRRVLHTDLPSYPETTAVALLGLQGSPLFKDKAAALSKAHRQWSETRSRLAKAWLTICLRNYGHNVELPGYALLEDDVLVTALEALACPNGGHQWLKAA